MEFYLSTNPLADNRAMESGMLEVWITGQVLQRPLENTRFVPGENARIPGSSFETAAQITPWRACAGQPQHRFQKPTIVGSSAPQGAGLPGSGVTRFHRMSVETSRPNAAFFEFSYLN